MENSESVIAVSGNLHLISVGNGNGYVLDTNTGEKFEVHSIVSILAKGDWEPVVK